MKRAPPGESWSPDAKQRIAAQLAKMAESPLFSNAPLLVAFLRHVVEAELSGRTRSLGQAEIAHDVLGKGPEFDPAVDSAVRVEAGRLRARLREYYATEGRDDPVRLTLPKGRYSALIELGEYGGQSVVADEPGSQDIRFLNSHDGISIAYSVAGTGPPLVKAANWLSHLEYDYQSPVWRHWWRDLSKRYTLVRYDERGCGLSDWDVEDFSLEAWVRDLEAVTAKIEHERFALLGISQGAAVAIRYALRHPERVTHLVLYGGFARGRLKRNPTPAQVEEARMLEKLVSVGWGQENPVFRKVFASLFIPGGSPEQHESFDSLQRYSTSARNAERFMTTFNEIDVLDEAAGISIPTLVMHARDELEIPLTEAKALAKTIPDAKLVLLDSDRHIIGENEPAWQAFLRELDRFLAG